MKKEDYMKLPKERLAELLSERDNSITYYESRPQQQTQTTEVKGFKNN